MYSWRFLGRHTQGMVTWCWKFISATEKNQAKGITHFLEIAWQTGPWEAGHPWEACGSVPSAVSFPSSFPSPFRLFRHHLLFYISHYISHSAPFLPPLLRQSTSKDFWFAVFEAGPLPCRQGWPGMYLSLALTSRVLGWQATCVSTCPAEISLNGH